MLILAAAIWVLLTLGLTYAARDATLLALPRLYLVAKVDFLADLLGCGYCTSFWTGGAAYLLLSGIGTVALDLHPGWLGVAPVASFAGTGLWYLLEALSPRSAIRSLTDRQEHP